MSKGLLKTAGKAAAWSALGSWIGLIAGITSLVVLARILAPEDFGIYGFVLITLALPETIACNSLNESLIQRKDLTKGHSNSVFVLSLGLACLFFLLIALIAPFIASGFGVPELTPYLRVMSIGLFIGAFSAVPAGHLLREMKFRQIATADIVATVTGSAVGILLAIIFQNAWALIGLELTRRFMRMAVFTALAGWVPSFKASISDAADLAKFNLSSVGVKLVGMAEAMLPRFIVGVSLGPAALGMYNLAIRLQDQAGTALVAPFGSISLPVASRVQHDRPALHRALNAAIGSASLVAYPAFLGAAAVAPLAIPLVFGEKWIPAIAAIQISFIIGLRRPVTAFNSGVLKGIGRPDLLLKTVLISLLALILMPFVVPYGLEAVMVVLLVQKLFAWGLSSWAVNKEIGFSLRQTILAGSSALGAACVMALAVWFLQGVLPAEWSKVTHLCLLIGSGVVVYVGALALFSPHMAVRLVKAGIAAGRGNVGEAKDILRKRRA